MIPEPEPRDENIVVIGSYSMAKLAIKKGWVPGAWDNDNYDYRVWSKAWDGFVFNSPAEIYPFGEIPFQKTPFFIRPCLDTKAFTGTVMDQGEYQDWVDRIKVIDPKDLDQLHGLGLDTPVLISPPKPIQEEYRFVVVDGKVITGSLYKVKTTGIYKECTDPGIIDFAQSIADIWVPSRAFALDICLSEGELYVLEMGCVNAAGLYDCDIQKIVMAFEEMEF